MENKNNSLVVLNIILIVLVLALGGYLVYDKLISKDNNETNSNNTETEEKEEVKEVEKEENVLKLDGTIYEAVTAENFDSIKIQKICNDTNHANYGRYYDEVATISDWKKTEAIFTNLIKQQYTEFSTTGLGYSDYQIDITYKDGNELKTIHVQPELVWGAKKMYLVTSSSEVESNLVNVVNNLYNQYK